MAGTNAEYYFRGIAKWAKVKTPDPKFKNYTLDLYLDKPSMASFKDSGLQLEVRDDAEGGAFIKLRRPVSKVFKDKVVDMGPPTLLIGDDYKTTDVNIGNGSQVVCKVRVYDTMKGKGHELVSIHIEDLVEYDGNEKVLPDENTLPF